MDSNFDFHFEDSKIHKTESSLQKNHNPHNLINFTIIDLIIQPKIHSIMLELIPTESFSRFIKQVSKRKNPKWTFQLRMVTINLRERLGTDSWTPNRDMLHQTSIDRTSKINFGHVEARGNDLEMFGLRTFQNCFTGCNSETKSTSLLVLTPLPTPASDFTFLISSLKFHLDSLLLYPFFLLFQRPGGDISEVCHWRTTYGAGLLRIDEVARICLWILWSRFWFSRVLDRFPVTS